MKSNTRDGVRFSVIFNAFGDGARKSIAIPEDLASALHARIRFER